MKKAGGLGLRLFVFLMTGMILSGIITVMFLTKSINLDKFYDVGAVYDVSDTDFELPGTNWYYNYEDELIVAQAKDASCNYRMKHGRKNWGYLYFYIENLSGETPARIDFLGEDSELLYSIDFTFQNGRSVLQLEDKDFYAYKVTVQDPVSFAIDGVQFREREYNIAWNQAPAVFAVALMCCFLLMLLTVMIFRRCRVGRPRSFGKNSWLMTWQKCYAYVLERCSVLFYGLSEREKSLLRWLFFLACMLLIHFSSLRGWTVNIASQKRVVLTLGVLILCIAFLSWEWRNKIPDWHNPLVFAWYAVWFLCIVSDFVVPKSLRYLGIFMLFAVGPFYLAWNSMKRPERLIREFLSALRWFYWGACIFCLFFSPLIPGYRYIGMYRNTNAFAGFLVTANVAFLTSLDDNLGTEKLKKRVLVENVFGLVTIWGFLMLTESITSLTAYAVEWMIFLWKQFPAEKKKSYHKNLRGVLLWTVISSVIVMTVGRWGITYVPSMIGTSSTIEESEIQLATGISPFSLKVEASGNNGVSKRVLEKITSGEWYSLFTGRTIVWKAYIRNWNLFGHSGYQECIDGKRMHAHNAVLQMINNYGIFIVIPYLIMLYYSLKYGIMAVFHKKRIRMNLFFVLASANYVVQGLAEDIATPYAFLSWLMFYIALGGIFHQQSARTET